MKRPIPFCSCGSIYRRFSTGWWLGLLSYLMPFKITPRWRREGPWWKSVRLGWPDWMDDIFAYWHRARYGWAPRDVWNLDAHLNTVLAGSLEHLALHKHGSPCGYPGRAETFDAPTDHERWKDDLLRWAHAFDEAVRGVEIYDAPHYERIRKNLHTTLKELEPWWEALWD